MAPEPIRTQAAIIGAGPAGLAAACEAAGAGARVLVVDEHDRPGGQLLKQIHKFFGSAQHRAGRRGTRIARTLLTECRRAGARVLLDTVAWGLFPGSRIACAPNSRATGDTFLVEADEILLAAGASENPLSFAGWTLPGVMGAGAVQTMMNLHRVLPGRRALVVGAGNVGLIVAFQMLQAGAEVAAVVESADRVGGYAVHAAKLERHGVPIMLRHTVVEALGEAEVEGAVIARVDDAARPIAGTEQRLDADLIAVAVGLSPLAELAWMAGCRFGHFPALGGFVPLHDEQMRATAPRLWVAGDIAGIEEASTAMEEGRLAGIGIAAALGHLSRREAGERSKAVGKRLEALRMGPFGRDRMQAKRAIIRQFHEHVEDTQEISHAAGP